MLISVPQIIEKSNVSKKEVYHYLKLNVPVVLKNYISEWDAYKKWNLEYLKKHLQSVKVPLYNNTKSDAYTPVNTADDYMSFGEYIDNIVKNPEHKWRLFLFNIYTNAPELLKDIKYPTEILSPIVKQAPMLFIGGKGAITHLHFDIDFSIVFHAQIFGKKKFLLFPFEEEKNIYRKPFEVLAWPDFSNYSERLSQLELEFPAIKNARGYEIILEPGDVLIMPSGCWHHIEYIDNSIAISMRAINLNPFAIARGLWYLTGMRWIDTFMKKNFPLYWNNFKVNVTPNFNEELKQKFLINRPSYQSL